MTIVETTAPDRYVLHHSFMDESLPRDATKSVRWVIQPECGAWVAREEYFFVGRWVHQDFTCIPEEDPGPGISIKADTLVKAVVGVLEYESCSSNPIRVELLEAFKPPLSGCVIAEVLLTCPVMD